MNNEQSTTTAIATTNNVEAEITLIKAKQDADFALTAVGQQVKQFEATMRIAKAYAASNFIPDSYRFKGGKPLPMESVLANCTIALEMATRMGANPLMVMQNLYIVHGQPAFSSKFLIASINASKRFSPLRYEFKGTEGTPDYACRAYAYEANDTEHKERLEGDWISMAMAAKEGWSTKPGSKWATMPGQMLRYRAAAFWQRAYCPEISMGLISQEEAEDMRYTQYEEIPNQPRTLASMAAVAQKNASVHAEVVENPTEESKTQSAVTDNSSMEKLPAPATAQAEQTRPTLL